MKTSVNIFTSFNLTTGNLNRFKKYLIQAKLDLDQLKVIHVVGTNGKGSSANYLAKNLRLNNLKVGLFTSPAFLEHNERIKINDFVISDQQLMTILQQIKKIVQNQPINFFEIFTWIAIQFFLEEKCDLAVFEAGIGGKWDSTNLFSNSIATLLTSLSYDHQDTLGSSITAIVNQKLGIANKFEPVFVSYSNQKYATILKKINGNLIFAKDQKISNDFFINESASLVISFCQHFNYQIDYQIFKRNILGRLTCFSNQIILDGAHNLDGIKKLVANLNHNFANQAKIIVYSSLKTKDFKQIISWLKSQFPNNFYVSFFDHKNAIKQNDLNVQVNLISLATIKTIIEQWTNNHWVIFCGSIYFIATVYQWLSLDKVQEIGPILPVRIKS
ncbi:bifunctional folylpolyglutamate synthase/dihydrofolate synthase [[Mycoplasma] cavipharyngis]|uniref:bifunctional folylpolyglutamate synthase/dihydrofolate synthase n=1 Tax=[Mycoplasma] cavipharyngis TaxID=92757 RepID=UPI0037048E72